jgi:tetratricopeptide (TPR) repeat protein
MSRPGLLLFALLLAAPAAARLPEPPAGEPAGPPPRAADAARPELREVPEVGASAEGLSDADREQLTTARAALEALLAAGTGAGDAELALAYGRLGQLYYAYDFLEPAEACFENAAALQPDAFPWHYYLGALNAAEGEREAAEEHLARAVALQPEDQAALIRLGRARLDRGDTGGAEAAFTAALESAPESAAAHQGLGRLRYEQDRTAEAIVHLKRALELQPEASSIHHLLGLAYRRQGDLEGARTHLGLNRFDPVTFPDPLIAGLDRLLRGARFFLRLGNTAMADGDVAAAVGHYRRAVEADPEDALAQYNLGFALVGQGDEEAARVHFRRAIELDPAFRNAHFNLAASLARDQRWDEAAAHYRKALEIDPQDHEARLELAAALAGSGQVEGAVRELTAVLDTAPDFETAVKARASIQLGRLAGAGGEAAEALEHFRRAVELDPGSITAHRVLARSLARHGRLEEAAAELGRVVELAPDDLGARFGRAMALLLAGQDAVARRALEGDLEAIPAALPLAHALARLLAASADPEVRNGPRALELALTVHRREETLDHAETVAMAYAATGDFERAVEWQRRVVESTGGERPPDAARAAGRRLEAYERGEPVRSPWLEG